MSYIYLFSTLLGCSYILLHLDKDKDVSNVNKDKGFSVLLLFKIHADD